MSSTKFLNRQNIAACFKAPHISENYSRVQIALICFTVFLKPTKYTLFHLTYYNILIMFLGRMVLTKSLLYIVSVKLLSIRIYYNNLLLSKEKRKFGSVQRMYLLNSNFSVLQTTIIFLFNNFLFLW